MIKRGMEALSCMQDMDPQAEWQAKHRTRKNENVPAPASNEISEVTPSEVENSLMAEVEMLSKFPIEDSDKSFEANLGRKSASPHFGSGPFTSTPVSNKERTSQRNSPLQTRSNVSEDSGLSSKIADVSIFDAPHKSTKPRGEDASKPVEKTEPSPKRELFAKPEKGKVTRLTSVPITPGRVLFLDESNLFRPIENGQQMAYLKGGLHDKPQQIEKPGCEVDEILKQLTTIPIQKIHHFSIMGQYFSSLREKNMLVDVIVNVDNKQFRAHRAALACYSKYFADTFQAASDEINLPLEVRINGVTPDAFCTFLDFVYSGTLEVDPINIGDMLFFGECLNIPAMKEKCYSYVSTISADKAIEVLESGKIPPSNEVYRRCYECTVDSFATNYDTNSFNRLSLDNLSAVLRDDNLKVKSEMDVFWAGIKWITYNPKERERHLAKVMECVRFPCLTQTELFQCIEATDLLKNSEKCRAMLIQANWIVSSEEKKKADPLHLPKPQPRLCFRQCGEESTYTFLPLPKDTSLSFEDIHGTFSCEVVRSEPEIKVVKTKSDLLSRLSQSSLAGSSPATPRSMSPAFVPTDILVVGGFQQDGKENHTEKRVEKYSCTDNSWKYYADLPEPRHYHAVAVLRGKLYLSGGAAPKRSLTKRTPVATNAVFVFDPEIHAWRSCAPMNCSRMYHKLCALYGMVYAIGGEDDKTHVLSSVECYNPKTNSWVFVRNMNFARMGAAATVCDGRIYVAGGHGESFDKKSGLPILKSMEAFHPRSNQWHSLADMRVPRCFASLSTVGNRLYLCGGASRSFPSTRDVVFSSMGLIESYDTTSNKWSYKTDMNMPRHHHGAAVLGTKIYLIGGMSTTDNKTLNSIECLDVKSDLWDNSVRHMPLPAKWISCAVMPPPKP